MELDQYGDKKKLCCSCSKKADLKEGSKYYCCDHYAIFVLGKPLSEIAKKNNTYDPTP